MSDAGYANSYRAPVPDNFRNGRRARFWFYSGFTLIELLVVIAVIAVLAAILFPVFTRAKSSAQQTTCLSNLRQLATAWQMYADNNSGRACPSYYKLNGYQFNWDFTFRQSVTSPGLLAPYLKNNQVKTCPAYRATDGATSYVGYAYNASYIGGDPRNSAPRLKFPCFLSQIQHPSRAAVFADAGYGFNPVMPHRYLRAPSDSLYQAGMVHFRHDGWACVAYADGHVKATNQKLNYYPDETPDCAGLSKGDSAYNLTGVEEGY